MFRVIDGKYNWWTDRIAEERELLNRRLDQINKFNNMHVPVLIDIEVALDAVRYLDFARVADTEGRSLAHIAVSAWDDAAKIVLFGYNSAKKERIINIRDQRILIAQISDNKGVSVLDLARKRLSTPMVLLRA